MKNLLFIIFFTFASNAYSISCFTEGENNRNLEQLKFINEFYDDVPSMADCKEKSPLNKIACSSNELKNGISLLSKGLVYAYENATHIPAEDHFTYNNDFKDWLNHLINEESNKDNAKRKLCYIMKSKFSDVFGSNFYYEPKIYEVMSSKVNQNGIVVNTLDTIIYLGKSCDAVVSSYKDAKSIWYNDGDQFVIAQSNKEGKFKEKYRFNYDEKVAKLNCEKPVN